LNKLMSMLRLTVGFAFVSVTAILTCLIAIPLLPSRPMRIKLCNYYGKFVGYVVVRLAAVTPEVNHRERLNQSFPAIYIANHTSTLDAFLSIWLCPIGGCGVMKKEILKIPFFNLLYLLSGHLLLDRAKPQEAVSMLTGLAEVVKRHRLAIWIMPEGTRSRDGRLLPFKKGFVHLAIATRRVPRREQELAEGHVALSQDEPDHRRARARRHERLDRGERRSPRCQRSRSRRGGSRRRTEAPGRAAGLTRTSGEPTRESAGR
jgi:1-acyl-sn-glycerol-3-phosphate acyltransferase